jgi:hypothetical protein
MSPYAKWWDFWVKPSAACNVFALNFVTELAKWGKVIFEDIKYSKDFYFCFPLLRYVIK